MELEGLNNQAGYFSKQVLDLISPFYFTLDKDLNILTAGKGMLKFDQRMVGRSFQEVFKFRRPFSTKYEFDSIKQYTKQIFILEYIESDLILRGQMIHIENEDELLFIGSPWVTKVEDLDKYGLLITDFALNDTTPDLLHVFQSQEVAMNEIKMLLQNLNEQKQALDQSQSLYKQLVEEAGDIILRTNKEGQISYINPVGVRILGLDESDIIGQHFTMLIQANQREVMHDLFVEQLNSSITTRYYEFPFEPINQLKTPWFGFNINLLYIEHGVSGIQMVARDITDRKQFENELMKAKEIAEESERVKEKFLANMSHEIRTPMNAIYGLANILKGKALEEEDIESVNAINMSAKNLIRIVNDILDFSKLESGHVEFENRNFSLQQVLKGVVQTLSFEAEQKSLEVLTHVSADVPNNLVGDELRLRQVLLNLCSNAIKFTENGQINIQVGIVNKQEKSCVLDIRVKDTGIGIPAEKLGSIFNSFTQASGDTTRKFGGTGLGLTIAHELVTQQKGDIQVRSVVGSGSEFIVTLPFELQPIQSGQAASDSIQYSFKELIGYKILMAEDHHMNQLLAKKLFKKWNCEIEFAHNGIKAIEKLKYQSFDLILMDLQMPEMDGYQTTSYIREYLEEPKRSIPIIAITAHALAGEKEKCLSLGMQDYISKPFDQEVLYRKILEQLSFSSYSER